MVKNMKQVTLGGGEVQRKNFNGRDDEKKLYVFWFKNIKVLFLGGSD